MIMILKNRQKFYGFLSRIYREEVDQKFLDKIKETKFSSECSEKELEDGYRMLTSYLESCSENSLTDLAADYAKVFLAAGIINGDAAFPYESIYACSGRIIMQETCEQVAALYKRNGLSKAEALNIPEDHISLELEFMGGLCQSAQQDILDKEFQAIKINLQNQMDFLNRHLLNWIPDFCTDVERFAETGFYKAVAKLTRGFVRIDSDCLATLLKQLN